MATRRLSAIAIALAAATTMAAPAAMPITAAATTVSAPSGQRAVETGMAAPAVRQAPSSAQQIIPLVNVPFTRRREAIWLGRPRDRGGKPWGSRRR